MYGFNVGDKVERKETVGKGMIGVILELKSTDALARVKWLTGDPQWVRLIRLRRL